MPRQRDQFPTDFPILNFGPCDAWRRAAVGPGHAARVQKQNGTASFVSRDVGVAVQENIDVVRRLIGRNVLKTEFQPTSRKVENQRPLEIAVAVSSHSNNRRSDRPQRIKNRFRTNITKMPDFVGILGHFAHALREPIVRVGENENMQHLCGFLVHPFQTGIWMLSS